jgi:hypothetical protein
MGYYNGAKVGERGPVACSWLRSTDRKRQFDGDGPRVIPGEGIRLQVRRIFSKNSFASEGANFSNLLDVNPALFRHSQ